MMNDNSLSPELKRRLAAMESHAEPLPEHLEDRVVERVRREGAFTFSRFSVKWLAIASAAAVLFVAGFFAGRAVRPSTPEFNYVLLLQEGASYHGAAHDVEMRRRVAEYREWASTLRSQGVDISGIKLQ